MVSLFIYFNNSLPFGDPLMLERLTKNLVIVLLSVTIRVKLFLFFCETHRLWCQVWGRFLLFISLFILFDFSSTVRPSDVLLMAANMYIRPQENTAHQGGYSDDCQRIITRDWNTRMLCIQAHRNQSSWYQINLKNASEEVSTCFSQWLVCNFLYLSFCDTRGVNPGKAGGIYYGTDTSLFSKQVI